MPSISFLDSTGFATLTNGKSVPRVNAWTPKRVPIGPRVTGLGTGRIHMFEFRTDDLVQFSLDSIPGTDANMAIMLRLQAHLLRGGIVTLDAGRTAYASNWGTCSLAPDTEPEIQFNDRDALEYSFVATLRTSGATSSDFYPALLPDLLLWLNGDTLLPDVGDGGLVPLWPDISGEDNDATQSNGARYPTMRSTGGPNDHAAVEFSSEDYLITPDIIQPTDGSTFFIVLKRTGTFVTHGCFAGWAQALAAGGTISGDNPAILEQTNGTLEFFDTFPSGAGTDAHYSPLGSPSTDWNIITLKFPDRVTTTPYCNGVEGTPFTPPSGIWGSNLSRVFVGSGNGSGVWYTANSRIAEVVMYGALLSDADRAQVEGYLSAKYAIALP